MSAEHSFCSRGIRFNRLPPSGETYDGKPRSVWWHGKWYRPDGHSGGGERVVEQKVILYESGQLPLSEVFRGLGVNTDGRPPMSHDERHPVVEPVPATRTLRILPNGKPKVIDIQRR